MQLTIDQSNTLLNVARAVIVHFLREGNVPNVQVADAALGQPAGCFVSLHRRADHALRGCVGKMDAAQSVLQAVRDTAVGVLADPRFADRRVTLQELPELAIEISVLAPLRPAAGPLEFDLLNDGLHLTIGGKSGVFLPQVARGNGLES